MKREFTIGVAWTAASNWIEQLASIIIFLWIARLIGAEAFGIASMAFAFLLLGEFLVRDTITEAIVERHEIENGRLEATFFALVGFSLVIMAALFVVSLFTTAIYGEADVAPYLMVSSPTVLLIGLGGVSTALLRRRLAYKSLAIRSVVGVIAGGLVGVAMALNGYGAWSLIGQRLAQGLVNSAFTIHAAGWMPQKIPQRQDFKLLRGLGPKVVILRSLTLIIAQTPTVALGMFSGPSAVGMFAFALRLAEIVLFLVVNPLKGVAQSALAEMRRQKRPTGQFFFDLTEVAALFCFTAFAGLALISGPVIVIMLGDEWTGAGIILPYLCLAGALSALSAMQESYLLAIDRLGPFVIATLIETVLGLAIIYWAGPFGATAVGAAVVARIVLVLPIRTRTALAPERLHWSEFIKTLTAPILATAGMGVTVIAVQKLLLPHASNYLFVAVSIIVGVLTFAAILFGAMPQLVSRLRTFLHIEN
ncbi:MAG: oligosaccharide flippase family protein [Marinosulfonomonas sp.]